MLQRDHNDSVTVSILSRRAGELQNARHSVTHHLVTGRTEEFSGLNKSQTAQTGWAA